MPVTRASDQMTKRFLRISTAHTLRETIGIILYGEQKNYDTGAIAIIDQEGEFAGIVTPHQVALGLLDDWTPPESGSPETAFVNSVESHLNKTIRDILKPDQPVAKPDATLARLVKLAGESEYECIPVVEEGRVEGLVYVSDLFKATANVALTPDTEGIDLADEK